MKKALVSQDWLTLERLVKEAIAVQDPAAWKLVITYALRGDDRDLELTAYRLLTGLKDPAATALIYQEAVKHPNFKTRIILLGVAGNAFKRNKDPAAFAVIAAALKDPSRPVALTAIKWIREAEDAERAVPALIDALKIAEKRSVGRVYFDIQNALKFFTGMDNLTVAADWKNYWDNRLLGKATKPRKGGTTVVRDNRFFSVSLDSDRILFIIDVSGSMAKKDPPIQKDEGSKDDEKGAIARGKTTAVQPGTKAVRGKKASALSDEERDALPMERQRLWRVQRELCRLIEGLDEKTNFTVMSFCHEIHFIGDQPRLFTATPENKKKSQDWVNSMQANGETWTDTAFQEALTKVAEVDTIFFLSDGAPFRQNAKIPEDQVFGVVKNLNRFVKARIHTFGFIQEGVNLRRFLQGLAAQNDGKFVAL
jgi:hypothetical protein